jgi:hypothetical protein
VQGVAGGCGRSRRRDGRALGDVDRGMHLGAAKVRVPAEAMPYETRLVMHSAIAIVNGLFCICTSGGEQSVCRDGLVIWP